MAEVAEENDYVNAPPTSEPNRGIKCRITKRVVIGILTAVLLLAAIIGIRVILHDKQLPRNLAETVTPTAAPDTSCPLKLPCDTGWKLNGIKCYHFSTTKSSWDQSRDECQEKGGDLVKIDSREQQRFLFYEGRELIKTNDNEDKFWIGLTDAVIEDQWRWVDDTPLNQSLSFWFEMGDKVEPDNWTDKDKKPEGEDCVRMGEMGIEYVEKCWFDKHCEAEQRFICEKEANKSPDCQKN
uniref:C-type lectin domain-containing protein n=1 Tax=Neogobius melanostomus TaxID=47308 RepID=A0A8C6SUV1_9GOBI